MSVKIKNQQNILDKLSIKELNAMQMEASDAIFSNKNVVLLSPTGTGKTFAFLLPIISRLDASCTEIQVLILVPSRELAIQIEQVTREMGTGYKTNAVYGGRAGNQDKMDLKHRPAILIGTPGRVADRMRRDNFSTEFIQTLVLDEFDKSLEVGFEKEMMEIIQALPKLQHRILTSATQNIDIPDFVGIEEAKYVDYLHQSGSQLKIKSVVSPDKDKLETLGKLLCYLGGEPGILFCNFKDTIQYVSDFLWEKGISHGCFYGGMDQVDRERALIKFRNGTHQLLIATDLAARGIDVPEIKFIIHYQLPQREQEFTHRNGRTARMNSDGTAYILHWKNEVLPEFAGYPDEEIVQDAPLPPAAVWKTLYISGGRRDKISKGDIVGLMIKQGMLEPSELGTIEIKQDCAFVGVSAEKLKQAIENTNNSKLKKKKVRVSEV